jgi:hypothetical protein
MVIKKILSVPIPLQAKILSFVPEVRTWFLMELAAINQRHMHTMERMLERKRRYHVYYTENIYTSCPHDEYTAEHYNDYHHNHTRHRCNLCNQELKRGDGKIKTGWKHTDD